MIEFSREAEQQFRKILTRYPEKRAALVPVLALAQREFGWISQEVAEYVGRLMDYPPSDVLSTATFYTLLRIKPVGRHHLEICRNVSCWLMDAYGCADAVRSRLGVDRGQVTADGKFSWDFTECLASCGTAPAMQVGDRYFEDLTPDRIKEVIEQLSND
jgi:NADH-quinone oxidoreductase E subunit